VEAGQQPVRAIGERENETEQRGDTGDLREPTSGREEADGE